MPAGKVLAADLPGGFARRFHRLEGAVPFPQPVANPGVARMTLPVITGPATVNMNDGSEGGLLPGDVHVFVIRSSAWHTGRSMDSNAGFGKFGDLHTRALLRDHDFRNVTFPLTSSESITAMMTESTGVSLV